MGRSNHAIVGAAVLAGAVTFSQRTEAAPVPQGTFAISAERLASSNFHSWDNGVSDWRNQLLGAPGNQPFDGPRLGLDYFVIDGLSIGGHLGFGLYAHSENNPGTRVWVAMLPRIGYAFSLSQSIDFWPRVSGGLIAGDFGQDTGLISFEAMFLGNVHRHLAISFGPAVDLPTSVAWQNVVIGGNAGLVLSF